MAPTVSFHKEGATSVVACIIGWGPYYLHIG
jgi:hypothetical protein